MKFLTVCCFTLTCFFSAFAQLLNSAPVEVEVFTWRDGPVGLAAGWWDKSEDEILKQVSKEEFEAIKNFNLLRGMPDVMSYYFQIYEKKVPEATFHGKMKNLHVYRIATFYHDDPGGKKSHWAILKVPYAGNENWDSAAKWNVVYFLVPAEHMKVK